MEKANEVRNGKLMKQVEKNSNINFVIKQKQENKRRQIEEGELKTLTNYVDRLVD